MLYQFRGINTADVWNLMPFQWRVFEKALENIAYLRAEGGDQCRG